MKIIIQKEYPNVKHFIYRHITIEKDPDGIFNPYAIILANEQVDASEEFILNNVLPAIKEEKDFNAKTVEWKDAIIVGDSEI